MVKHFGIHDIQNKKAEMFLYSEHYAQKSPDEVISCLNDYMERNKTDSIENLLILCNNCFSQNKNRFLFCYLYQLCVQRIF